MRYDVRLTVDAERDIEDIYRYIAGHGSVGAAERVLAGIQEKCSGLAHLPARGNIAKELLALGIRDFREAHYKPYRIIYRVAGRTVIVFCVLDGRWDMQSLLQARLLRP
jgi:toxin ParE1/3/4